MPIANRNLRDAYLPAAMAHYFRRKLPDVPEEVLAARIEETLKFLIISPLCTASIPVTAEIDEIWHYWILQTRDYAALCASLPSPGFIDHCSNDYLDYFDARPDGQSNLASDVRLLAAYVDHFGPFAADRVRYWKLAAGLCDRLGWTTAELNDWLASTPAEAAE